MQFNDIPWKSCVHACVHSEKGSGGGGSMCWAAGGGGGGGGSLKKAIMEICLQAEIF